MRILSTIGLYIVVIAAGLQITVAPAFCQMQLKIADILRAPDKYYNQQVKISGKVTSVKADGESMSGTYILVEQNNIGVEIISDILPLVGKKYQITVVVYEGPDPKIPLIREVSRSEKSRGYIGWILGGVLIVFAVMLVFQGSGNIEGVEPVPPYYSH